MSVLVLRFGREGLVVFKQMKYGYDIGLRIECLVRRLKTITSDHNNLYIWSCGHWKFTTSVPKVNLLRLLFVMKADLAMMFQVSLLGMRGQCYSVVTLVIIVSPAGA